MWCVPAGLTVAEAPQQDFFHTEVCTTVGAAANCTCSRLPRTWTSTDITQGWPRVPTQPSSVISTLRVKLRRLQLAAFRWKTGWCFEDYVQRPGNIKFSSIWIHKTRNISISMKYFMTNTDKPCPYLLMLNSKHLKQGSISTSYTTSYHERRPNTSLAVINRDASEQRLIVYRASVWGRTRVCECFTRGGSFHGKQLSEIGHTQTHTKDILNGATPSEDEQINRFPQISPKEISPID